MLLSSLAGLQSPFPSSSPGKIHVTRKSWARREREKPIALYNIARAVPGRRQQEWRTFICIRLDGGSTVERSRGESYDWKMQFTQVFFHIQWMDKVMNGEEMLDLMHKLEKYYAENNVMHFKSV